MVRMGRATRVGVSLALGLAAVALAACVDLFHSTDFGSCDEDAGSCGSGDGGPPRDGAAPHDGSKGGDATVSDGGRGHDARADAPGSVDGGMHDATTDHRGSHDGPSSDAHHDGSSGSHDAGVDATIDFCAFSPSQAQQYAMNACAWLGACEGTAFPENQIDTCYRNALPALDCIANPNMRVSGPVHAFWNALRVATSCGAVDNALWPGGVPACTGNYQTCSGDLVISCSGAGATPTATNCAVAGLTCVGGICDVKGALNPCDTSKCTGNVLHRCVGGVDEGQDCTNFGAGTCNVPDGGAGGCVPSDSTPCAPSAAATCTGNSVVDCTSGSEVTINCSALGPFACSSGLCMGDPSAATVDSCNDAGNIQTDLGTGNGVVIPCQSGLGTCRVGSAPSLTQACRAP